MSQDMLERLLEEIASGESLDAKAPSRLKSRIYSVLMRRQAESGPLMGLAETLAGGRGLCVFESLTNACPVGETAKRLNLCEVCHARVLAEHLENAPVFWHNCPYVRFQDR